MGFWGASWDARAYAAGVERARNDRRRCAVTRAFDEHGPRL